MKSSRAALCIAAVALGILGLAGGVARAQVVVFDSFGPANSYLGSVAWGVNGASVSGGYRGQAEKFVPAISGYLSSITVATIRVGGSGRSNFFITQDNGGVPGTILETYANTLNGSGLLTMSSISQPLLQAGQTYWFCDEPADATSATGWFENNQNRKDGFAFERSPSSWEAVVPPGAPPSGVMRVSVIPIPEPGVASLLLGGLGAGFLIGRRTRSRA